MNAKRFIIFWTLWFVAMGVGFLVAYALIEPAI